MASPSTRPASRRAWKSSAQGPRDWKGSGEEADRRGLPPAARSRGTQRIHRLPGDLRRRDGRRPCCWAETPVEQAATGRDGGGHLHARPPSTASREDRSATAAEIVAPGAELEVLDTRKPLPELTVHLAGMVERHPAARRRRRSAGRRCGAPGDRPQPHRHPHPAGGADRGPRRSRQAGRLAGDARAAALRLHPLFRPFRREEIAEVERRGQRPHPPEPGGGRRRNERRCRRSPPEPRRCSAKSTANGSGW